MGAIPKDLSNQGIFDAIVTHLRKQGRKAQNVMGDCLYRAPNGDECAFGCIISDDVYRPRMENISASTLLMPACLDYVKGLAVYAPFEELITRMQDVHDKCAPPEWERCWADLARASSLTYTPPAAA